MTRDEYERHKQRLEAELRSGVEMLYSSYQAQRRALEMVWMAGGGTPALEEGELPMAWQALGPGKAVPAPAPPVPPVLPPPQQAPRSPRRAPGKLYEEVRGVLSSLPEEFGTREVRDALEHKPHRGSLHRTLEALYDDGWIEIVEHGVGRMPSVYRKLRPAPGKP